MDDVVLEDEESRIYVGTNTALEMTFGKTKVATIEDVNGAWLAI